MNKRVTMVLALTAVWSFCLLLLGGILPWIGMSDMLGELAQPLAQWLPLTGGIFLGSVGGLAIRYRQQSRYSYPMMSEEPGGEEANDFSGGGALVVMEYTEGLSPAVPEGVPTEVIPQVAWAAPAAGRAGRAVGVAAASAARVTKSLPDRDPDPIDDFLVEEEFNGRESSPMSYANPTPLHQLPPALPDFAGRSFELAELAAARTNPETRVIGLQGMGGVGKTTLAVKFAHQIAGQYPDAQIYLDLKGASAQPLPVADAQGQIIRAYLPTARLPEHEVELNRLYHSVMNGKRALLVLDNAVNVQQVAPLLPPEGWLTILTSRQYISLPGMFVSRLNILPMSESRELLRRLVPHLGGEADRIAELSGHLPLALRVAACTMIQHPELRVPEYVEHLAARQGQGKSVDGVLLACYELLTPGLQKLWRYLAAFTGTFDLQAAASVWKINPQRAGEALNRLMAYSLIERNRDSGRYRLHDLMLYFTDTRLSGEERQTAKHRFAAHYQSVLHEADALYEQGGPALKQGLDLLDLEWQNIHAGQVWATSHAGDDRAACELCNSYPDAGKYLLSLRQHPRERIRWNEAALEASRALNRRKAAGRHLVALGDSYTDLSEIHHAIDCYEQALETAISIGDRRGEADARTGLGTAYYLAGSLDQARQYHEEALDLARQIQDQRVEAMALGNLGMTHYGRGEASTAQVLFDQQFRLAREIGDRRNESVALGGIGMSHLAMENPEPAIDFLGRQFLIAREIGDRRGEASALCNLGNAYVMRHDHRKAMEVLEEALAIAHDLADRRCEANALGGLGSAYFYQGEPAIARQFFEQQVKLSREIGDRRGECLALNNLSEIANTGGDHRQSVELAKQAIEIAAQIGDLLGQGTGHYYLALAFATQGERKKALAHAEQAIDCLEETELPLLGEVERKLAEWRGR